MSVASPVAGAAAQGVSAVAAGAAGGGPQALPQGSSPATGAVASPAAVKTGPPVKIGITDPISLQEPSDVDSALSQRMTEGLEKDFPRESPDGARRQEGVLRELERLFVEWVVEVGVEMNYTEADSRKMTTKLLPLGSHKLGVKNTWNHVDILCIGPPYVSREAFFTAFVERLKQHQMVAKCVPIADVFTPILRTDMGGIRIDILFARLAKPLESGQTLEEATKEDDILRNMDDKSVRCLNGYRVAEMMLQLVPNAQTFRETLRFVKCWARQRGLYSNALGFFGGITWALLVARVCQLYPYYSPSQLVNRFFRVYDQWNWSKPVMLCEIEDKQGIPGMSSFKVWNPKANPADRQHIMPVITPAFPAMNSTYAVTETTKRILLDEFRRGYESVKNVEAGKTEWRQVHEPFSFFGDFRQFLSLEVLAKTDEVQQKFSGWVDSKLRILTKQLEAMNGLIIHPNPRQYDLSGTDPEWPCGCGMFIALAFFRDHGAFVGQTIDLRPSVHNFIEVISHWSEKDMYTGQYSFRSKRIKANQIPAYAGEADRLDSERKRGLAPKSEGGTVASAAIGEPPKKRQALAKAT